MTNELLDQETIAQAEALGLHARLIVEGFMSGEHRSPYRGASVEFTQYREYTPGDDLRHLDWKLLARTDRHYVKQYEARTNFVAHLMLDVSESMAYGSGSVTKIAYARQLVACLAYLILSQRDAVALTLFDRTLRRAQKQTSSIGSMHQILTTLIGANPANQTDLAAALHALASSSRKRGIVILVSDLLDDEMRLMDSIRHIRFAGHELMVFHVLDPAEMSFPFTGNVEFEGLETPAKLLTRPAELRNSYLRAFNAFRDRVREGCERQQSHYVPIDTSRHLNETLGEYLAFRRRVSTV